MLQILVGVTVLLNIFESFRSELCKIHLLSEKIQEWEPKYKYDFYQHTRPHVLRMNIKFDVNVANVLYMAVNAFSCFTSPAVKIIYQIFPNLARDISDWS